MEAKEIPAKSGLFVFWHADGRQQPVGAHDGMIAECASCGSDFTLVAPSVPTLAATRFSSMIRKSIRESIRSVGTDTRYDRGVRAAICNVCAMRLV